MWQRLQRAMHPCRSESKRLAAVADHAPAAAGHTVVPVPGWQRQPLRCLQQTEMLRLTPRQPPPMDGCPLHREPPRLLPPFGNSAEQLADGWRWQWHQPLCSNEFPGLYQSNRRFADGCRFAQKLIQILLACGSSTEQPAGKWSSMAMASPPLQQYMFKLV